MLNLNYKIFISRIKVVWLKILIVQYDKALKNYFSGRTWAIKQWRWKTTNVPAGPATYSASPAQLGIYLSFPTALPLPQNLN